MECVLKQAHGEGKKFRVILVESTPKREAKNLMQKLVKEGIHCTLVLLNAVSYAMKEVSTRLAWTVVRHLTTHPPPPR